MSNEQFNWLMNVVGMVGVQKMRFHTEYLVTGGGYNYSTIEAASITELIDTVLDGNCHSGEVVRMQLTPYVDGKYHSLELMHASRI